MVCYEDFLNIFLNINLSKKSEKLLQKGGLAT